jgi:hypothetical protein
VPKPRWLLAFPGPAAVAGPLALRQVRPGKFLRERQQRVRRAGDNVTGNVDDALAPGTGSVSELLECLPRPNAVPFSEYSNCLLHPDPDRESAF